ncbi:D-glycero-alpha-D-manno-heptose-1,7-bisphosphate 7-phosphatase [Nonomuraea sediminis]|uniref:D-glycero-alpha-D-manno-heptose-1,7-bisphosphate 7-phosphatase n=1 Tax=Nonomuraea sediminis TaxID=2835864 RepID=UPI001BDCB1A2|nr:HAD-IIIA family hydrolase [Nonomuraea sediminis]
MFGGGRPCAVLFDRDGTLIKNVPYNGDPDKVEPMPGAVEALRRLRAANVSVGVVTDQSGVAKGLLSADDMDRVNVRVEELLGPFDAWAICVHDDADGCTCRKPASSLVIRVACALEISPRDCVVVGDIGKDIQAARSSGAHGILVPTPQTRPEEIELAREVARDLTEVADRVLSATPRSAPRALAPGSSAWAQMLGWSHW